MLDKYISEQKSVTEFLNNCISTGRYSHAYLFVINGYSNFSNYIYDFIKSIICPNNFKCEGCNICSLIDTNSFSDFKLINTNSLVLKKEEIIELQSYFDTKKLYANKRIYLIENCEKMNASAANTLLKFLEEPEEDIIAILTTDNINLVLDTIKSRCQIINFSSTSDKYGYENLYKMLCHDADISFEQFDDDVNFVIDFCKFYDKNRMDILAFSKKKWHVRFDDRVKFKYGLSLLLYLYIDLINIKLNRENSYFLTKRDSLIELSRNRELNYYVSAVKILQKYIDLVKYNVNLSLCFDKIIIELEGIV